MRKGDVSRRIVFVIPSLSPGGAERVMTTMANYWVTHGQSVTIFSLDDGSAPPFFELHNSVSHVPLGLAQISSGLAVGFWNNLKRMVVLRHAILGANADAVISFIDKTNILTLFSMWGTRVRLVVSERTDPSMYSIGRAWSCLRSLAYANASRIVVQTAGAGRYFLPRFRDKLAVIPNPVLPLEEGTQSASNIPRKRIVLAIGRLSKEKGFSDLLRAYERVAHRHKDWSLIIIGDGPEKEALGGLCRELDIAGRVSFLGTVKNPSVYLQQAGLFVLASHFEGFPNALCEAMAHGVAVISTDCPSGPGEIVEHGMNGFLVPPGNVDALAQAMDSLIADEQRRIRMGDAARRIVERYGVEAVMEMWEEQLACKESTIH